MTGDPGKMSIGEALALLRRQSPGLLEDLSTADRVLWVGSGVSYGLVPGLKKLLWSVLDFLQRRINDPAEGEDHRRALEEIVAEHLPHELVAFRADPANWAIPGDLAALVNSYSSILGTEVGQHPSDYLLWEAIDVRETYGALTLQPGAQHRLIAYLLHEGIIEKIVTTNWDGLIEKAVDESSGRGQPPLLGVLMTNESFRTARGATMLVKQHGCAVMAREDVSYREYLVSQTNDIAIWLNSSIYSRVVSEVRAVAKDRKSLMLGFSAQDYNVLVQIAAASQDIPWTWDISAPAYIFAEPQVNASQKALLSAVYGDEYPQNRPEICAASAAGMYSGPLLGAGVLHLVIEKFMIGVDYAHAFAVSAKVVEQLKVGLTRLEVHIADEAESDLDRLVELLRSGVSALTRRYFRPADGLMSGEYMPVYGKSLKNGAGEEFKNLRISELAVALGLLGLGCEQGYWALTLRTGLASEGGVIELTPARATATPLKFVVTKDWEATNSLKGTDLWALESGELVVIQATGDEAPALSRGIGRGIGSGRKVKNARRSVWLSDLAKFAADPIDLMGAFRAEVSA